MLTTERSKEIIWNAIQLLSKARQELNPGENWKNIDNQIFIDLNLTPDELDEIIDEYPWE